MKDAAPRRRWQPFVAVWGAAVLLLWVGSVVAVHDDARGATALGVLEPLVGGLATVGAWWASRSFVLTLAVAVIAAALLLLVAWRRRLKGGPMVALAATSVGLIGQVIVVTGSPPLGAVVLAIGTIAVAAGGSRQRLVGGPPSSEEDAQAKWCEVGALVAVVAIATALRLYALDRVIDSFDGELTGYYAAATRLSGVPLANEGVDGSWAPLGLTFYPPYVAAVHAAGTTVLALRLAAAWVGVLSIPLLYTFVRRLAGGPAALTAAALLALDPLSLGWSRSDVHPHGFTLWPVLLVCLAMLAALRGGGRRAWFATALTMGLAWHQYPSGQVAVLIPPLAVALLASGRGGGAVRWRRVVPFLLFGVLLWFAGLPLSGFLATGRIELRNPFTLTGGRAAWSPEPDAAQERGRLTQIGRTVVANAADLTVGIFREARVVSHQEFLPEPGPLPARTVPWTVAVFGLLGTVVLARRRADPGAAVLLAWLVVAPLPALLAVEAYPKRAATLFPALICAAAVFVAWLISAAWPQPAGRRRRAAWVVVGAALGLQVALTCFYWFSGRQWPSVRPSEIAVARHVADHLVPGTLVIVDGDFTYLDGKLLFLLLEDLAGPGRRPNAYAIFQGETAEFRRLVEQPTAALAYLDEVGWPYRWTRLARQRDEIAATRKWQRVIWVIAVRSRPDVRPNPQHVPLVRASCPDFRERSFPGGGVSGAPHDVTVLVCQPAAPIRAESRKARRPGPAADRL